MKNNEITESPLNITFDRVLEMTTCEFYKWCVDFRAFVVDLWDNKGLPPRVGFSEEEMIDQFEKMISFPVHTLEVAPDIIRNTSVTGNAINDFFPTMMKTKITYSKTGSARSIYDYFADPLLLDTFITYASRHFKRDSFYHYSTPISIGDILKLDSGPYKVTTAEEFIKQIKPSDSYGYWLCGVKENKEYTGYNLELKGKKNLIVGPDFDCPEEAKVNVDPDRWTHYSIRIFKKGQRLFPVGLKAFRVSFCQYATQYPPLFAKYFYERFTEHIKNNDRIVLYDPSMGWGGRCLGAMAVDDNRNIHYIGTDPNGDHVLPSGKTKYHQIMDNFNQKVRNKSLFPKAHTYEIFQKGSEVIQYDPEFQKYKGKVDLVFTSPPYFSKEVYSDDPEQSCHKFETYNAWRDGFLKPTLETCVEWLASDRYLVWNISNISISGKLIPLEEDSCKILESLGMKYVTTVKMILAQMPGGNRTKETDKTQTIITNTVFGKEETEVSQNAGITESFIEIKSKTGKKMIVKYEPCFVFYKPW